jgi:GNAT superfamily N-acetyltransferase
MHLEKISFDQILPIWNNYLWPERVSEITPTSAMCYLGGYDLVNMDSMPTFFAYMIEGEIAGVNSGHMCKDNDYRSRGLYVFEKFRGRGIGTILLKDTIEQAKKEEDTRHEVSKIDIRVGRIINIHENTKSEKLYNEEIDITYGISVCFLFFNDILFG